MPFDEIIDAVKNGDVDAGLLIHEGQLFYKQMGLDKVLDLGEWWFEKTGLPLPMGGNVDPTRSRRRPDAAGLEAPAPKHRVLDGKPRRRACIRDAVRPRHAA